MSLKEIIYRQSKVTALVAGLVAAFMAVSCRNQKSSGTSLATVVIDELADGTWNNFLFQLVSLDPGSTYKMDPVHLQRGVGQVKTDVPAGKYQVLLEYYQDSKIVYSAHACDNTTPLSDEKSFVPGLNHIDLQICTDSGASRAGIFYTSAGRLYDKTGAEFLVRGVNNTFNYFLDKASSALPRIKALGFNTVRVVWCADNLVKGGRCDQKDMHSAQDLSNILDKMRALQLVAVIDLQNPTGSDDPADLAAMADYYLKPEISAILMKNKDMVILNIGNEWFGSWQDPSGIYFSAYKSVITRLRQGNIPLLLLIDGGGWGQDFSSIQRNYQQLMLLDDNLMFSTHMYEVFSSPQTVSDAFATVRANQIPWMVGEFGCSHGSSGQVACDTIFNEANSTSGSYGYIGWSFAGNSSDEQDLDITTDWNTLSNPWGTRLVTGAGGISTTAKIACFFNSQDCQ